MTRVGFSASIAALVALPLIVHSAIAPRTAPRTEPAGFLEEFAVAKDGRVLTVPVKWRGENVEFLVDTGASMTIIDTRLQSHLGPAIGRASLITSAGPFPTDLYACPAATIGSLPLGAIEHVACCDLEQFRFASGRDVYGVLGMDFFGRYAMELDFDRGLLTLLERAPDDWNAPEEAIPLIQRDGRPYVAAKVGRCTEMFVLDTGANRSHVARATFARATRNGELTQCGYSNGLTLGGEIRSSIGYATRFSVGEFTHSMIRLDRDVVSGLGLQYLARYRIRFDFPNRVAYLHPSAGYSRPDPTATSGMALVDYHGRKMVVSVEPGSAAARAKVEAGDVLVALDGRSASGIDMHELSGLLTSEANRRLALEFERGGRKLLVDLTLQSRLPTPE